jgi:hypothetical protein
MVLPEDFGHMLIWVDEKYDKVLKKILRATSGQQCGNLKPFPKFAYSCPRVTTKRATLGENYSIKYPGQLWGNQMFKRMGLNETMLMGLLMEERKYVSRINQRMKTSLIRQEMETLKEKHNTWKKDSPCSVGLYKVGQKSYDAFSR